MIHFPLLVFSYNRPCKLDTLFKCLGKNALLRRVYLFVDGPQTQGDKLKQKEILRIFFDFVLCKEKKLIIPQRNLTPRFGIPWAISQFFLYEEAGIFLEDDLVFGDAFLYFADNSLLFAKNNTSCSGFVGYWPFKGFSIKPSLGSFVWPWGWGTNRRTWTNYGDILGTKRDLFSATSFLAKDFFLRLLIFLLWVITKQEKNFSWFYRWQYVVAKNRLMFLNPQVNLVSNRGFDNSGLHTSKQTDFLRGFFLKTVSLPLIKTNPLISEYTDMAYKRVYSFSFFTFFKVLFVLCIPKNYFFKLRKVFR